MLCGDDREAREELVADPYTPKPVSGRKDYLVDVNRVLIAILPGVITCDANEPVIRPAIRRERVAHADSVGGG